MDKMNRKRMKQLRMPFGTACARLRKAVMFQLVQDTKRDVCFRCGKRIKSVDDFTLDHKRPWLGSKNPIASFFSIRNIAFSHHFCNTRLARKPTKKYFTAEAKKMPLVVSKMHDTCGSTMLLQNGAGSG
jgi:hypothetical protein